jgi:hypothetical protein
MTETRPDPLVPPDVDLRDFPFTPIFRSRLFGSSFHARVTDAEWRAGVTLWLKSWDQVPAGTLPTDDIDLCRLAEFGRDRKSWSKVKQGAMHGWVECTDGRLHHRVVAEGVLEAWSKRNKAKTKGKAGASARWGPGNSTGISPGSGSTNATANAPTIAQAMPGDSKGREEKGIEEAKLASYDSKSARESANGAGPRRWDDAAIVPAGPDKDLAPDDPVNLRNQDRPSVNGTYLDWAFEAAMEAARINPAQSKATWKPVVGWLKDGIEPEEFLAVIRKAAARPGYKVPGTLNYFDEMVRESVRVHA